MIRQMQRMTSSLRYRSEECHPGATKRRTLRRCGMTLIEFSLSLTVLIAFSLAEQIASAQTASAPSSDGRAEPAAYRS